MYNYIYIIIHIYFQEMRNNDLMKEYQDKFHDTKNKGKNDSLKIEIIKNDSGLVEHENGFANKNLLEQAHENFFM